MLIPKFKELLPPISIDETDPELRRWVSICLGLTWADFSSARWCGVRDSAHEKIYSILEDPNPEVRAAAVFALGTFINSTVSDRTEHANAIDHSVAMTIINKLCGDEGSPLVRQEIVVALHYFMLTFENNFVVLEQHRIVNQGEFDMFGFFERSGTGSPKSKFDIYNINNLHSCQKCTLRPREGQGCEGFRVKLE